MPLCYPRTGSTRLVPTSDDSWNIVPEPKRGRTAAEVFEELRLSESFWTFCCEMKKGPRHWSTEMGTMRSSQCVLLLTVLSVFPRFSGGSAISVIAMNGRGHIARESLGLELRDSHLHRDVGAWRNVRTRGTVLVESLRGGEASSTQSHLDYVSQHCSWNISLNNAVEIFVGRKIVLSVSCSSSSHCGCCDADCKRHVTTPDASLIPL